MRFGVIGGKEEEKEHSPQKAKRTHRKSQKKPSRFRLCELCALCGESSSRLRFFRTALTRPTIHFLLRQPNLGEHAAYILRDQIVDRFRLVIKRWNSGHDPRARHLRAQHI